MIEQNFNLLQAVGVLADRGHRSGNENDPEPHVAGCTSQREEIVENEEDKSKPGKEGDVLERQDWLRKNLSAGICREPKSLVVNVLQKLIFFSPKFLKPFFETNKSSRYVL